MYKIVRVGIPIQNRFVSQEFLNIIDNILNDETCIALTTIDYPDDVMQSMDYISAPAGHRIICSKLPFIQYNGILQTKCINTIGFVWSLILNDRKRFTDSIGEYIVSLLEEKK